VRIARALAAVLLLAACTPESNRDDAAHIVVPGDFGEAGIVYHDVPANKPYTLGDLAVCLSRAGQVTVTRIEPEDVEGSLELADFALVPNQMETGGLGFEDGNQPIRDLGLPTGPYVLDKPCPEVDATAADPQTFAVVLEYRKTDAATAGNSGIRIHYESDGESFWVSIPWKIRLCAPGDAVGDCELGAT
jgi:hypothetical protein